MSDLQTDLQFMLKEWDDGTMAAQAYPETFVAAFVEAARRWANPNIEAAAKAAYEFVRAQGGDKGPWDEMPEGLRDYWRVETRIVVNVALTSPGDTK